MALRIASFSAASAVSGLALVALLSTGCDRILGIKDPTLGEASPDGRLPPDAPTPGLVAATIPLRVAVSDIVSLVFLVAGPQSSSVGWAIDSGGGDFDLPDGTVAIGEDSIGTITVGYRAPAAPGIRTHTLNLFLSSEVAAPFNTHVATLQGAGQLNPFADNAGISVPADFLYGQQITIPRTAVLMRLGFHSQLAGGNARMALYTNNAGVPQALVASSGLASVVAGPNDLRVTPTMVEAGTYWLLGNFTLVTPVKRDGATSGDLAYLPLATTAAFPDPIVSPMATTNRVLNFYLRFAD